MLELPESQFIAGQITDILGGRVITSVQVEKSPHKFAFYSDLKDSYGELLTGQTIVRGRRAGGLLVMETEEYMLIFTDGACPRYYAPGEKQPQKHQLYLASDNGGCVAVSVRMYGYMGLWPIGSEGSVYYQTAMEKPDPLGKAFTIEYFLSLVGSTEGKLTAKTFLATEQRIPGLGNGVLQDILWTAGLDPRRKMADMTEVDIKNMYAAVTSVLADMCRLGGRCTESDLLGKPCGYPVMLSKNTLGTPCRRCGEAIEKAAYMGGTVYFCPGCQKK